MAALDLVMYVECLKVKQLEMWLKIIEELIAKLEKRLSRKNNGTLFEGSKGTKDLLAFEIGKLCTVLYILTWLFYIAIYLQYGRI